jgi:hypothetical protein
LQSTNSFNNDFAPTQGDVSKLAFKVAGIVYMLVLILFATLGIFNLNGFARLVDDNYLNAVVLKEYWFLEILIEAGLWTLNMVMFAWTFKGVVDYSFVAPRA